MFRKKMSKTYFNHERKYRQIRINLMHITTFVQLDQAVQCTVYVQAYRRECGAVHQINHPILYLYIYMEINMYFYCIPTPGLLLKLFLILDFMCQDLWDLLNHLVSSLLNLSVYVPEVRHWFILLPSAFCSVLKYFLSRSIPWDIVNLNQGWSSLFLRALLLSRILYSMCICE